MISRKPSLSPSWRMGMTKPVRLTMPPQRFLLRRGRLRPLHALHRPAGNHETAAGDVDVLQGAAGLLGPGLDVGYDNLFQILPGAEEVQANAVAQLTDQAAHVGVHRRDVDGDVRMLGRAWG